MLRIRFLTGAWLIANVASVYQGPLQILQDGSLLDLHVVALSQGGSLFQTDGRRITLRWGDQVRGFVATQAMDDMPAGNYHHFSLLGKALSYDVDLSAVGCSCNAALFFVSMPGYHPNGTIAHGDFNPYYCDGNDVGGVWCWEHDAIEANKFSMATTPHACSGPPGRYIESCDMGGCRTNSDPDIMCPRAGCTIDTRKPFRVVQQHEADADKARLLRIRNRIEQGNVTYSWDVCKKEDYLDGMSAALKNVTMVFQMWGDKYSRMEWLDAETGCSGDCDADATEVTFSNIEITSLPATPDSRMIYL